MEAVGKMIHIIEEERGREGIVSTVEAGKSILAIIGADHTVSWINPSTLLSFHWNSHVLVAGSTLAAVSKSVSSSSSHPTYSRTLPSASSVTLSALSHASTLMRSLVRLHAHIHAPVSLSNNYITTVGFQGDPSDLLCTSQRSQTNHDHLIKTRSSKASCRFHIPDSFTAHLKTLKSEVVQVLFGMEAELESNPLLAGAEPPISTTLVGMELASPQGKPLSIQNLHPDQAIRVTLPNKYPLGPQSGHSARSTKETGSKTCLTLTLPTSGNFTVKAVNGLDKNAGLYISFNFSLEPGTV